MAETPSMTPPDTPTPDSVYEDFWKPILETRIPGNKGASMAIDSVQLKKELFDYFFFMKDVALVYCHVTGGLISKPNTHADVVIGEADRIQERAITEALDEAVAELRADHYDTEN